MALALKNKMGYNNNINTWYGMRIVHSRPAKDP